MLGRIPYCCSGTITCKGFGVFVRALVCGYVDVLARVSLWMSFVCVCACLCVYLLVYARMYGCVYVCV